SLTNLSTALTTGTSFEISTALSSSTIAASGTATVSVRPVTGLAAGTYTDHLVITGDSVVTLSATLSFTVNNPYQIISGDGSTYQQGSAESVPITLTASGPISSFLGLNLNGMPVDPTNYDVQSGSTIVTLHQDYLETLDPGTYTLTFLYTDGEIDASFVLHEAMPETGDRRPMVLYAVLALISGFAIISGFKRMKRKRI
ncbi:MAG TPA: hypothetical protein P5559_10800, partial [Candidatus Limiplasma sp.]|nr:hypothetical protein [Candidatus Limiplasma sp.]